MSEMFDIAIIGAGMAGASLASFAAPHARILLLEGEARLAEATRLLEHAAQLTARAAVERLWVELARARLTL